MERFLRQFAFLMLFFVAPRALAGAFYAEIDKKQGGLSDQFSLIFVVSGDSDDDVTVPKVNGLKITYIGPSKNISIINGKYSKETQYRFVVTAEREGTFTIPSVKLKVDGEEQSSLPITLVIKEESQKSGLSSGAIGGEGAERSDFFIERQWSSKTPYVGEQVLCTIKIYHRLNIVNAGRDKTENPAFRIIPTSDEEKQYTKVLNGIPYNVIEINEIWVPLKEGKHSIFPFILNVVAEKPLKRRRGDIFDMFPRGGFFGGGEQVERRAASKTDVLEVRAVPVAGKPQDFSGLIGDFAISSSLSQNKLKAGDTTTLTVTVSGNSPLEGMKDVKPDNQPDLKIYEDKPETKQTIGPEGISSTKTYKFALVPTKEGTIKLGQVRLSFFDIKKGEYREISSSLGELTVLQSDQGEKLVVATPRTEAEIPGEEKKSVKMLGEDLIEPHREASLQKSSGELTVADVLVLGSLGGGTFLFMLLSFGIHGWRQYYLKDTARLRRSKAMKRFAHAQGKIANLMKSGRFKEAVNEGGFALRVFIGDKVNVNSVAFTANEIEKLLRDKDQKVETVEKVKSILTEIEYLEYSSAESVNSEKTERFINELVSLARLLERTLK